MHKLMWHVSGSQGQAFFDDQWADGSSMMRDGHLDAKRHFGTLIVTPYPFHASMSWPGSQDDLADLQIWRHGDKVVELSERHESDEGVLCTRTFRRLLLSLSDAKLSYEHTAKKAFPYTVQVTRTDKDGNSYTTTETHYDYMMCHWKMASVHCDDTLDGHLKFHDGYSLTRGPNVGWQTGAGLEIPLSELGIDAKAVASPGYTMTAEFARLLTEGGNNDMWRCPLQDALQNELIKNGGLCRVMQKDSASAPIDFVAGVLQTAVPLSDLDDYLQARPSDLVDLCQSRRELLLSIEELRAAAFADGRSAFWFVFFHDVSLPSAVCPSVHT